MARKGAEDVYRYLVDGMANHRFVPGDALPSENLLCKLFEISRPTVRRAMDRLVSEGRIERRQGIGCFVRSRQSNDTLAKAPRELVIGIEGLTFGDNSAYYRAIASGARNAAAGRAQFRLIELTELENSADELDGLICTRATAADFERLAALDANGTPVVLVNRYPQNRHLAYVSVDFQHETFRVIAQLLRNGAHRVGLIGHTVGELGGRSQGWSDAYRAAGLEIPLELRLDYRNYTLHDREVPDFLDKQDPEVLFVTAEYLLLPVLNAVGEHRRRTGHAPQVFCFDDVGSLCERLSEPVSFLRMPLERMGDCAVEYLISRATHPAPIEPLRRTFSTALVLNGTNFLLQ